MKPIQFEDLIVFENDNFLAVSKPAGLPSLHAREPDGHSLIEYAKQFNSHLQLCHRLDKETSGVLLLAKNENAYRHASIQFEKRKVEKNYHAICHGTHSFTNTEINHPLIITRSGKSAINYNNGKPSKTLVDTVKMYKHYTLVNAQPLTGRLHQIRIHLASQNAPIAADLTYGGKFPYLSEIKRNYKFAGKTREENPMMNRVALHAFSLKLLDVDGSEMIIQPEYSTDFYTLIKLLEKNDQL